VTQDGFNVLTDPWIPIDAGGRVELASYPELLTGARDGPDLLHPRDDVKFFAQMLLSALTQALFPPRDSRELARRLAEPLAPRTVSARINEVAEEFNLFGTKPFLQDASKEVLENETSRLFLDLPSGSRHLLFRPATTHRGICAPCAVPALYGAQAFAPSGGRGLSPGVRGAPPITTLVVANEVRQTMWANVLSGSRAGEYRPDPEHPWRQKRLEKVGDGVGLLTGLFWQPRSLTLAPHLQAGRCCACGAERPLFALTRFEAKSKVIGGFFPHPHTPCVVDAKAKNGRTRRPLYLRSERPAWTGLADMLSVVRGKATQSADGPQAAPVVSQWLGELENRDVSLAVLAYATDKAKITGRFSESYALSMQKAPELVAHLRGFVERAEATASALGWALKLAHASRRDDRGGYWSADAAAELWRRMEAPFWNAVAATERGEDSIVSFCTALRRAALRGFDEHTEPSAVDNTRQSLVAKARGALEGRLFKILDREVSHAA
jgi:CRISPR type I-E-associated protein CasA/Cse1